jgi:hypothetical protein
MALEVRGLPASILDHLQRNFLRKPLPSRVATNSPPVMHDSRANSLLPNAPPGNSGPTVKPQKWWTHGPITLRCCGTPDPTPRNKVRQHCRPVAKLAAVSDDEPGNAEKGAPMQHHRTEESDDLAIHERWRSNSKYAFVLPASSQQENRRTPTKPRMPLALSSVSWYDVCVVRCTRASAQSPTGAMPRTLEPLRWGALAPIGYIVARQARLPWRAFFCLG